MKKEVALGLGLGILFFALLQGLDVLPLLLVGILLYVFYERGGLKVLRRHLGHDCLCQHLVGKTPIKIFIQGY